MKKLIKIFMIILSLLPLTVLTGCEKESEEKITIISTSFPGYDFARAITKDSGIEVKMLIKPGSEIHDYEPSPKDIVDIQKSKLFIYIGGDSDDWIEDVLKDIDKSKTIKLTDLVDTVTEEKVEGMEIDDDEVEEDEHVWTSPINAIEIIEKLTDEIKKIDNENIDLFEKNKETYKEKLLKVDSEIRDVVNNAKRKEIIFADRFPIRYFADEYGLTYYAAFPGCSESVEASAKTISFLIDKVKQDKIPAIFKIELSNGNIAKQISKETNSKILEFNSAHNISQKDFDAGLTYAEIMNNNKKALKEALG